MKLNQPNNSFQLQTKLMISKFSEMKEQASTSAKYSDSCELKTHRKKEFSFASPVKRNLNLTSDYNLSKYKLRSPLKEQEIQNYNRVKSQLKMSISMAKQNYSHNQQSAYVSYDDYNALCLEHKYEIDKLLLEIARLHENVNQVETNKRIQLDRVKDQQQKANLMNVSNLKQTYSVQIDQLQAQLRKIKDQMYQKTIDYENLVKKSEREARLSQNENQRLNQEVKVMIEKKNDEISRLQSLFEKSTANIQKENQKQQSQRKSMWDRQLKKLQNKIQRIDQEKSKAEQKGDEIYQQNQKLSNLLQQERAKSKQVLTNALQEEHSRYNSLKAVLGENYQNNIQQLSLQNSMKQEVFDSELKRLKCLIKIKNQDRQKLISLHNERIKFMNEQLQQLGHENREIKKQLEKTQQYFMQELQITKVKMAALHENDIKQLVATYQSKIDQMTASIKDRESQDSRLRKNLYEETNRRWEMKKKYDVDLSKLRARVIKMRSGISAMEIDMKEKIQNERSMMLLTSRSLIKDVQSRNENNKFLEEQLRKLRQLFDLQEQESKESNIQVQEKIRTAEEQLSRLSRKILQQKNHHQQAENHFKQIIASKDEEIKNLRTELQNIRYPEFNNDKQLQMIEELKKQVHDKNDQINKQKDQIKLMEDKIAIMKAEIDQYQMEIQISQEQAKKQYQQVSSQNMKEFKIFYENKIKELEVDKEDLKLQLSNKDEKFTDIVQKYRELEQKMKDTLKKISKRTELEKKVMQMGSDNNLVKNLQQMARFS